MKNFDLIIIGGGRTSNLVVKAGKKGKKVALIEKQTLGGTCPNKGCVPSKLLIGYAHVARAIKEYKRHFINSTINNIDIQSIDSSYAKRFNRNVEIFRGEGKFLSNTIVEVNDEKLIAQNIVVATGTRPIEPLHVKAWSSDDIFPLKGDIPKAKVKASLDEVYVAIENCHFT